jgi:hypothetical protein
MREYWIKCNTIIKICEVHNLKSINNEIGLLVKKIYLQTIDSKYNKYMRFSFESLKIMFIYKI